MTSTEDTTTPVIDDRHAAQVTGPAEEPGSKTSSGSRDLPALMATVVTLIGSYAVLLLTFTPSLLFRRTLATGGDTGSHHYVSKALEQFLPWSLSGWATGWYAGMPMLEFYFPTPYVLIWLLSHVAGYQIAFKLITVLGMFLLPVAAWALFRLLDAPRLAQAVAPAGAIAFLWIEGRPGPPDVTQLDIFGGFITSTMAGEFGYSIALSMILVCLGLLYRATRRSNHKMPWYWIAGTGALTGITITMHIIPIALLALAALVLVVGTLHTSGRRALAAAIAGATVLVVGAVGMYMRAVWAGPWTDRLGWLTIVLAAATLAAAIVAGFDWRRATTVALVGALGLGVAAFWLVPFWSLHEFTAPAKWINVYGTQWFLSTWFLPFVGIAAVGVALGFWRRRPGPLVLAWTGLAAVCAFQLVPSGPMVNGRLLPIWYLMVCLLAAWAIGEALESIPIQGDWRPAWAVLAVAGAVTLAALSVTTSAKNKPMGPTWAAYNYSGYQAQSAWPELTGLMRTIEALPPGRVAWEYNSDYSRFGTPRALENIPFFTSKDTMEGLLVEGSTSAFPHFWLQGLFSPSATGAVPGYPYPTFNAENATKLLRLYGDHWFVAETESVKTGFRNVPGVREYTTSGNRFSIFEITGADLVRVPESEPVLLSPSARAKMPDWRTDVILPWLQDPEVWDVPLTLGAIGIGASGNNAALSGLQTVSNVGELSQLKPRPVKHPGPIEATLSRTEISFRTDKIGEPHLIAVSYFPNWRVEGANGPYFVAPSLMLVYPTQPDVRLSYGTNPVERVGWAITLVTLAVIAGLCVLARRQRPKDSLTV